MLNKGHIEIGAMYLVFFLFIAVVAGSVLAGGKLPTAIPDSSPEGKTFVSVEPPSPQPTKGSLQMYQIYGIFPSPSGIQTIAATCDQGVKMAAQKSTKTCFPDEDCIQEETFAYRCSGNPGFSLVNGDPPTCVCK